VRSVSVVIPVFRGADSIQELASRTLAVFDSAGIDGEIIFVNDDSPDNSWEVICALTESDTRISGISLMRNYGQHGALLCGTRNAKMAVVVTLDDDLQHRPESIPELLTKIDEGFDVVYAAAKVMPHAKWRNFLSLKYKQILALLTGSDAIIYMSAYRVFRTELRTAFDRFASPHLIIDFLLSWASTRYVTVFIDHDTRRHGRSTYSIPKLFHNALVVLTGYSVMPLHFATLMGFSFTLFGLAIFIYSVILGLSRHSIPGFPFISSLIAVMGGVQLFCLGIIGEYLAGMYQRTYDRPPYVIRERTCSAALAGRRH
jgi:glycosyltransferase involved in cell wall biosynthesis